jgi:hypothetical protein
MDNAQLMPHRLANIGPRGNQRGTVVRSDLKPERIGINKGVKLAAIGDIDTQHSISRWEAGQ